MGDCADNRPLPDVNVVFEVYWPRGWRMGVQKYEAGWYRVVRIGHDDVETVTLQTMVDKSIYTVSKGTFGRKYRWRLLPQESTGSGHEGFSGGCRQPGSHSSNNGGLYVLAKATDVIKASTPPPTEPKQTVRLNGSRYPRSTQHVCCPVPPFCTCSNPGINLFCKHFAFDSEFPEGETGDSLEQALQTCKSIAKWFMLVVVHSCMCRFCGPCL